MCKIINKILKKIRFCIKWVINFILNKDMLLEFFLFFRKTKKSNQQKIKGNIKYFMKIILYCYSNKNTHITCEENKYLVDSNILIPLENREKLENGEKSNEIESMLVECKNKNIRLYIPLPVFFELLIPDKPNKIFDICKEHSIQLCSSSRYYIIKKINNIRSDICCMLHNISNNIIINYVASAINAVMDTINFCFAIISYHDQWITSKKPDDLIINTAKHFGCPVITYNTKHFKEYGIHPNKILP